VPAMVRSISFHGSVFVVWLSYCLVVKHKFMKYTIGLDLGITSVGWSVVNDDKKRIEDLGVRIFTKAENPKSGASLAEPRRVARSMRRRLRRRNGRLQAVKRIFIEAGLPPDVIVSAHAKPNNPYLIRAEALDRVLTPQELFILVYQITKRRGYKSNRKKIDQVSDDKEKQAVLGGIQNMKALLEQGGFTTVGQILHSKLVEQRNLHSFGTGVRNHAGSYENSVSREMLEAELKEIFLTQRKHGNTFVTDDLERAVIGYDELGKATGAFNRQRHYVTGDILKKMVGICTFENESGKGEMRAAKATYSFQYFNLLQKLNNLKIDDLAEPLLPPRGLSLEEKQHLISYFHTVQEPSYHSVRTQLKLKPTERFNISYFAKRPKNNEPLPTEAEIQSQTEKTKFSNLKDYIHLKKIISETNQAFWNEIDSKKYIIDEIATILTLYRTDEDVLAKLDMIVDGERVVIPDDVKQALLGISFAKFGHLSLRALRKLIPHLENGLRYDEAVTAAGYGSKLAKRHKKLPPLSKDDNSITNPVVKRTVAQTIKVINAIIDRYGSPFAVHIELGRELSKSHKERGDIEKQQKENASKNERARQTIKETFRVLEPKGQDIIKYRLWEEQENKCAYSGVSIDEKRLFEDGYVEIDHIIPFSRSWDDSFNNKVLVMKRENQQKGNRTPYEYLGGEGDRWRDFEVLVESYKRMHYGKRRKLLLKKYTEDELTTRALNDTRYISRYIKNYIENSLEFSNLEDKRKKRVITINGMATAYLRKRWTFNKSRETDIHHAQDAVIVAVIDDSMVQQVAKHSKMGEVKEYLQLHKRAEGLVGISESEETEAKQQLADKQVRHSKLFPLPWEGFREELNARLSSDPQFELEACKDKIPWYKNCTLEELPSLRPIFVSRMPKRKVTGRAHEDTLRSPKWFKQQKPQSSVRTPLTSLTLEKLRGEQALYLDPKLKMALITQLDLHNGDAKKAFAEPFYKTMKNGERGPQVRSVKLIETGQKSGLLIHNGNALVDRASMIRVDIFVKQNKKDKDEFYFIPIYAHHVVEKNLPVRACTAGKRETEWEKIDDSFSFKFSLYPGDLIRIIKEGEKRFWYYVKAGISTNSFTVESHDGSETIPSMGIKTLDKIDKYVVDVLGNYHQVSREPRLSLQSKAE